MWQSFKMVWATASIRVATLALFFHGSAALAAMDRFAGLGISVITR